jgi:predicted Zn-dependent protease
MTLAPYADTRLVNAAHGLLREALDSGADDALVQIEARRAQELSMGADGRLDLRQGSESLAAVTSVRGQRRETRLVSGLPVGDMARSRPWLTAEEAVELLREVRDGGDPATARALLGARLSDEAIATVSLTADGCERVSIRVTCGISQWATGPGGQHLEGEFAHGAGLPAPGRLWSRRQELIECRGAAWRPDDGATRLLLRSPLAVQLISSLAGILNGAAVTGSLSVLRDRIGRKIGSPAVTLIDDGLPDAGPWGTAADAEGTPTRRNILIEEGVLRGFLHTRATAKACAHEPNGAAVQRRLGARVRPGPRGLRIAGSAGPDDLRARLGDGLEAVAAVGPARVIGRHGEFAVPAVGWEVTGGRRRRPFGPVVICCKLFAALRGLEACGADLTQSVILSGIAAPSLLLAEGAVRST